MRIEMAWRDERINVLALSGFLSGLHVEPQLFVCKKNPIIHRGPFLLDPRRGRSRFRLSALGILAQERTADISYPLSYVAEVTSYLRIPVRYDVFAGLCSEGWFSLWDPSVGLSYFDDLVEGYLAVMDVSRFDGEVSEMTLEHGRAGANFVYYLESAFSVRHMRPIQKKDLYEQRVTDLRAYLAEHGWLLGESEPADSGESWSESLF